MGLLDVVEYRWPVTVVLRQVTVKVLENRYRFEGNSTGIEHTFLGQLLVMCRAVNPSNPNDINLRTPEYQ